jgi:salicylate hydroxylase
VVELGARVQDFAAHSNGVTVAWLPKSGAADATGMALIGADGLWSTIRVRMGDSAPPRAAGRTAWRTLVPAEAVAEEFRAPVVQLWMGPGAHLVHYPVRAGRAINIVAISTDGWQGGPGWSAGSDRDELMTHFSAGSWAKPARALLETPQRWLKWGLYDRPPLRRWSRGAATLLGDAAHPMLPFLAQGAAMAIEDAAVLAASLAGAPGVSAAPAALRRYEAQRRSRTARVQEAARANDRIYHLGGPVAAVRDFALRVMLGGDVVARRYDWIYHWRPPARALSGS